MDRKHCGEGRRGQLDNEGCRPHCLRHCVGGHLLNSMNTTHFSIDAERVTVCCMCHPSNTIFDTFPGLRGQRISHGMCNAHLQAERAKIRAAVLAEHQRLQNKVNA